MALLTPLTLEDARRLGSLYGLAVHGVRGIPAGSVNSNFELALEGGGRALLRVYEEQDAAAAAREAILLDHLAARGVPTPRPLPLAGGGFVAEHAHKPVAAFPWIEGEILCQRRVTPAAARQVGAALARVHAAGDGCRESSPGRFGPRELGARTASLEAAALAPELARDVRYLAQRLADLGPRWAGSARPGLIHGDLFRDNVLWSGGDIAALLDFESASLGNRAFDLAVTVLAWSWGDDLDAALAAAMAAGYSEVRALSTEEREDLHVQTQCAALRFAITRITDFELRPAGSGVHKDYRRFLGRLRTVEELGAAGLRTILGL